MTLGPNDIVLRPQQGVPNNIMLGAPSTTVVSPSAVATTTKAQLAAGGLSMKWVICVEGYQYLLTDATPTAAATAHSGRDWTLALGGLFVDLKVEQAIDPWNPFTKGGGKLTFRVQPDAADTFGIDLNRRAFGAEGRLTSPMDRGGSYVSRKVGVAGDGTVQPYVYLDNTVGFAQNTDVFVGTECVGIGAVGGNQLQILQRGKYSPFASGGLDSLHFAEHHRITADPNGVMLNPVCSQYPRTWKGKLVGVWLHVCQNGVLNSRANAQLVFAGRIAATYDDQNTGFAVVECDPIRETLGDTMVGRDMYGGSIMDGLYLAAGRTFRFQDKNTTSGAKTANDLVVVASGASGTNQINAGYYSLAELCSILNSWLGGELAAARILGSYTWTSPVNSGQAGLRTRCVWTIPGTASTPVWWSVTLPGEVAAMLAVGGASDPTTAGDTVGAGAGNFASSTYTFLGTGEPWTAVFIRRGGAVSGLQMNVVNQRGTLVDQYALLPAVDKPTSSNGASWGYFLINDQCLMLASFTQSASQVTLTNCAPSQYAILNANLGSLGGITTVGRHASDQSAGPLTIKQVFILAGSQALVLRTLFYSTGTLGYNQRTAIGVTVTTVDDLGYGLGLGIPAELLGSPFDISVNNLPGAQSECVIIIDEPTKLSDAIGVDLVTRWAFPIWKDQHLVIGRWQTPISDLASAALTESNKAEPAGQQVEFRPSTSESDAWEANQVKVDYNRDITLGSKGDYNSSITFEDTTAVDDNGGVAKAKTLEARNNYHDYLQTGQGVQALMPHFFDMWSLFSRPLRITTRSIDIRLFEGLAPGDIITFNDNFMRDPATGQRRTQNRTAIITRHSWNLGGPDGSPASNTTQIVGEVDLAFIDLHRWARYAPAALLDSTQFSAGYDSTTRRVALTAHEYTETFDGSDNTRFNVGDRVLVYQLDPDAPDAGIAPSWTASVLAVAAGILTLDQPLSGFDTTKAYAVTYDTYANCTPLQQGQTAFECASATGLIAGTAPAVQWASSPEPAATTSNPFAYAEFLPGVSYGDGRAHDIAAETSIVRTLNAFHDYGSAHQLGLLLEDASINSLSLPRSLIYCAPIHLGSDQLSNSVFRYLNVGPIFKNASGGIDHTVTVWVTLSKSRPIFSGITNTQFPSVQFMDVFSTQSWTSPADSAAIQLGTVQQLTINVKNTDGTAWLCVETSHDAQFYGFHSCYEGTRQTQ